MSNDKMVAPPRGYYYQPPAPPTPLGQTLMMTDKLELRVVEYVKGDRLVRTELQYRVHQFDHNGGPVAKTEWEQVDRVRISID